uniref:AIP/AIPL N-terminal FKBP-type PPIase domain-containing protein n=1 Tax=Cairina moschata TaxID=8855 RepID=A0A8C3D434_CAIMO
AMEETYLLNVEGVKKKILHGGQGELPKFQDGSKITFHFQTLKDNFERTVIDDSREAGIPMEIIVGKMFKMEIWETLLSSMRAGEVAEFWCDAIHTGMYALVSKGMRRIAEGRDPLEGQKHRCGMGNMFDYHSTGYDDLDELQRTPQPLIFIMELFRVEEPSAYKRDTWAMSKEEKLAAVPVLHSEGNRLVLRKEFRQAAEKYQEAVICLRNLQAKEKPWEEGWLKLESLVTPLVLNYCQCQLELGEYYEVLEHTTELLQKHKDNAKAYFKRAKAHAAVWNEREAREDFLRVAHLDPAMAAAVKKELKQLGERMRKKHVEDRKPHSTGMGTGCLPCPWDGEAQGLDFPFQVSLLWAESCPSTPCHSPALHTSVFNCLPGLGPRCSTDLESTGSRCDGAPPRGAAT